MGELAASIAHELNQPLGSIVVSGDACLRWLAAKPPNLDEVLQAVEAIIRDGNRASSVLVRIRGLIRRGERLRERSDVMTLLGKSLPCRTVNFAETVHPCGRKCLGSFLR